MIKYPFLLIANILLIFNYCKLKKLKIYKKHNKFTLFSLIEKVDEGSYILLIVHKCN